MRGESQQARLQNRLHTMMETHSPSPQTRLVEIWWAATVWWWGHERRAAAGVVFGERFSSKRALESSPERVCPLCRFPQGRPWGPQVNRYVPVFGAFPGVMGVNPDSTCDSRLSAVDSTSECTPSLAADQIREVSLPGCCISEYVLPFPAPVSTLRAGLKCQLARQTIIETPTLRLTLASLKTGLHAARGNLLSSPAQPGLEHRTLNERAPKGSYEGAL